MGVSKLPPDEKLWRLYEGGAITRAEYVADMQELARAVRFDPPAAEERKPFTRTQKDNILLRQAVRGADDVFRAYCAGEGCKELIAFLDVDGRWKKLRPMDFDHVRERAAGGATDVDNGQALCAGPESCHAEKTSAWAAVSARADRMGGRSGQAARRAARKARGERGPWGKR